MMAATIYIKKGIDNDDAERVTQPGKKMGKLSEHVTANVQIMLIIIRTIK